MPSAKCRLFCLGFNVLTHETKTNGELVFYDAWSQNGYNDDEGMTEWLIDLLIYYVSQNKEINFNRWNKNQFDHKATKILLTEKNISQIV